jgi:4-amino-4-deoxy-L-arabinose transferase-like glycosyltransferase
VASTDTAQTAPVSDSTPRSASGFSLSRSDRRFLVWALVALLAIRLLMMFWLPFIDTTEARYAEIARKMLETGDWITPQFEYGVPFWGKPPLHTWLSAAGMKVFGVNAFGARIFILFSALATLWLVFDWTRRHKGADLALVAVSLVASSLMFLGAAAFVMTDMVMTLGTTLSMMAFFNCVSGQPRRRLWGHLFFVGLAIGMLAKGPTAVVLTGIPITGWLLFGNRWRLLGALPWISGLALALVLTLPWYIAAELKTPGFLRYFIIGEHIERFIIPKWQGDLYGSAHPKPKGMIWLYAIGVFLPWSLFVLGLLPKARRIVTAARSEATGWNGYLVFWVLSPLILFTPAANILAAYALPAIPAAGILLATAWAQGRGNPGRAARVATAAGLAFVAGIFLLGASFAYFSPDTLRLRSMKVLVAEAGRTDPEMVLTNWGSRSYSAEFYTSGKVERREGDAALAALLRNSRRDAVAVRDGGEERAAEILGDQFTRVGRFGRHTLFVENPAGGAGS